MGKTIYPKLPLSTFVVILALFLAFSPSAAQAITVVDDFAHHPTAVAETLLAARGRFPGRRLLVAFEPRTNTSRRRIFQQDYVQALAAADLILVREPSDLWKAPEDDRFSSPQLVADLSQAGRQAWYFPDTDDLLAELLAHVQPGDTVLVMSNGGFDGLIPRLCQALGQTRNNAC